MHSEPLLTMRPALRTLVHYPWQAAVPTFIPRFLSVNACLHDAQGHSCLALLQFGQSSVTQCIFHATCRQDVDHFGEMFVMRSASAHHDSLLDTRRQDAKLPFSHVNSQACRHVSKCKHSSHIHTSASEGTNGDAPKQRSQDAVQHTCNANDSIFASALESKGKCFEALHPPMPSQAPHVSARCKGQKKSESLELLHRKVSLLELEQVSLCDASTLRKSRAFKSTSFEHLAAVLKFLKELLGSGERACRALAIHPGILLRPSELLEQNLKVLADFGIKEEIVRKLFTTHRILPLKVEPLHKTLSFLEEIGLTVAAKNRLLRSNPRVLRTQEGYILRTLDFLKSLGMSGKALKRSMCMRPSLLMCSVHNLREKYNFFQQLGFTVNEFTRFTCAGLPMFAVETVKEKIKFFKDQGFSDGHVHMLISRYPAMLGLTCKVLKSKLDFLLCEQNYDMEDIVKGPICLSCSLQDRLIPRLKALKEKGLSKVYTLSTIMSLNDLRFQELGRRGKGQ